MKKLMVALVVAMALSLNAGDEQISVDPSTRVTTQVVIIDNDFQVDSPSTLFVDKTENKVGINDAPPSYALDVTGEVNATAGFKVGGVASIQTGAAAPTSVKEVFKGAIFIQDNADVYVGTSTDSSTGWVKVN